MNNSIKLMALWLASSAVCLAQMPMVNAPPGEMRVAARGPSYSLALEAAQTALESCEAKGAIVSVSVVDSAGVLKILLAGDGADLKSVTSSTWKAITAIAFKTPISELGTKVVRGGLPMLVGDQVVGGIGVGGGHGGNIDEDCARAGLEKIQKRLS